MDVYRSMGYVQMYFGVFLAILGLLFVFVLVNDVDDLQTLYYEDDYMETQARQFGISENSLEYKMLYDNYDLSRMHQRQTANYGITMDLFMMIIFLLFGLLFISEGIAKTRLGKSHELHPKQKLVNNLLLAGIVGLGLAIFLMLVVA